METDATSSESDVQILLEIAESLLGDGDPAGALQAFTDALVAEPRNVEALVGKGRALMTLDRDEQAIRFLELATNIQPDLASSWMLLGTAALATGNGELAARAFSRSQRLGVAPAESYLNMARAAYFSLDLEKARDYAQLALTEAPENGDAVAWSEALGQLPDRAAFLVDVGRAHCRRGRFETGLGLCLQSVEVADSFAAHLYGGRALVALQRPAEADAEFRKALALQPDSLEVLNDLAEIHLRAGEDTEADKSFDRILAAEPDNADGLAGKARVLLRAGNANAAAPLLKELVALAPSRPDTWLLEAWRLKAAGRGRRARLAIEHAIALDTLFPPAWMEAAALFDGMGDASIAGLCRRKAMYLTGEDDAAERGTSDGGLRDVDAESAELDELELQPEELAVAWSNRAAFYAALGELDRAIRYLDMIAQRLPHFETEEIARHRGSILLNLNDISGSRAAFQRALELDPNNEQALRALQRLDAFSV